MANAPREEEPEPTAAAPELEMSAAAGAAENADAEVAAAQGDDDEDDETAGYTQIGFDSREDSEDEGDGEEADVKEQTGRSEEVETATLDERARAVIEAEAASWVSFQSSDRRQPELEPTARQQARDLSVPFFHASSAVVA